MGANGLTVLHLSFPICKMGIIAVIPSLLDGLVLNNYLIGLLGLRVFVKH